MTATSHWPAQRCKPSKPRLTAEEHSKQKSTWGGQITGSMLIQFDHKVHFLTSTSPTSSVRWNQGQRDANAAKPSSCLSINIICDVRKGNNPYASPPLKYTNVLVFILNLQLEMMSPPIRGLAPQRYLVFFYTTQCYHHIWSVTWCLSMCGRYHYPFHLPEATATKQSVMKNNTSSEPTEAVNRNALREREHQWAAWVCVCVCVCVTLLWKRESVWGSRGHDRMDGRLVRKQCTNQQTQSAQRSRPFMTSLLQPCVFSALPICLISLCCEVAALLGSSQSHLLERTVSINSQDAIWELDCKINIIRRVRKQTFFLRGWKG